MCVNRTVHNVLAAIPPQIRLVRTQRNNDAEMTRIRSYVLENDLSNALNAMRSIVKVNNGIITELSLAGEPTEAISIYRSLGEMQSLESALAASVEGFKRKEIRRVGPSHVSSTECDDTDGASPVYRSLHGGGEETPSAKTQIVEVSVPPVPLKVDFLHRLVEVHNKARRF